MNHLRLAKKKSCMFKLPLFHLSGTLSVSLLVGASHAVEALALSERRPHLNLARDNVDLLLCEAHGVASNWSLRLLWPRLGLYSALSNILYSNLFISIFFSVGWVPFWISLEMIPTIIVSIIDIFPQSSFQNIFVCRLRWVEHTRCTAPFTSGSPIPEQQPVIVPCCPIHIVCAPHPSPPLFACMFKFRVETQCDSCPHFAACSVERLLSSVLSTYWTWRNEPPIRSGCRIFWWPSYTFITYDTLIDLCRYVCNVRLLSK